MSRQLASHNEDIRRLVEAGFAVSEDSNYLVVRDIPYLDENLGLAVTSRKVVRLFLEQFRLEYVPVLHGLQWRLAAQG